jgi:hypothetical protein
MYLLHVMYASNHGSDLDPCEMMAMRCDGLSTILCTSSESVTHFQLNQLMPPIVIKSKAIRNLKLKRLIKVMLTFAWPVIEL